MTRSEWDNPTITTDLTTDITTEQKHLTTRSDFEEIEPENIPEIATALLALLEIALLNKKNKTWLKEQHQKEQKKLSKD